jgi:hypothetical protein
MVNLRLISVTAIPGTKQMPVVKRNDVRAEAQPRLLLYALND